MLAEGGKARGNARHKTIELVSCPHLRRNHVGSDGMNALLRAGLLQAVRVSPSHLGVNHVCSFSRRLMSAASTSNLSASSHKRPREENTDEPASSSSEQTMAGTSASADTNATERGTNHSDTKTNNAHQGAHQGRARKSRPPPPQSSATGVAAAMQGIMASQVCATTATTGTKRIPQPPPPPPPPVPVDDCPLCGSPAAQSRYFHTGKCGGKYPARHFFRCSVCQLTYVERSQFLSRKVRTLRSTLYSGSARLRLSFTQSVFLKMFLRPFV